MAARIPLVQLDDERAQRAQFLLNQAVNNIIANPLLNGVLLSNVSITTGVNSIEHKLDRPWVGYIVTARSAGVTIFDVTQDNRARLLQINSSGDALISLWVF